MSASFHIPGTPVTELTLKYSHARVRRRAAWPLASHPLSLRHLAEPEPDLGQLRIRVRACALCRTDLHIAEGELPMRVSGGIVPGHQVVGVVDAVGPDVGSEWLGQRTSSR